MTPTWELIGYGVGALVWLASIAWAGRIMDHKGHDGLYGIGLGGALGVFGVLVALLWPSRRLPCPACQESVHPAARLCPHCRSALDKPATDV